MLPFIGRLLSSTLLWCCLLFSFTQFVIFENLSIFDLALSGVKGFNFARSNGNPESYFHVSNMEEGLILL